MGLPVHGRRLPRALRAGPHVDKILPDLARNTKEHSVIEKKKLPVLAYLAPCPDCNARCVGRELRHEPSCPLANSVEDVCEADRQWFLEHPGEQSYTRPLARAEVEQMRHTDPLAAGATQVIVVRHSWGRTRGFLAKTACTASCSTWTTPRKQTAVRTVVRAGVQTLVVCPVFS